MPRNFPIMSVHSGVLAAARRFQRQTREEATTFRATLPLPSTPPQPSHTACANQPQSHPPTMMSVTNDSAGVPAVSASCKRKAEADRPGSPAHDAKIAAMGSRTRGPQRAQPKPRCGKCAPCIAGAKTGRYRNKCKAAKVSTHACMRTRQAPGCVRAQGHCPVCGSCAWPCTCT